jgi:asparagine synthase (glutamine-hydrolysing)
MDTTGLLERLRGATREIIGNAPAIAVAYSGGLDSSVIAATAREYSEVKCYTCAIEGSFDSLKASEYAALDGLDHLVITLPKEELPSWVIKTSKLLTSTDPIRIAYTIPTVCVLEGCREGCLLAGNGADELFGGYAKYSEAGDPSTMMAADLDKMLQEACLMSELASTLGKRIGFPFAAKEVVSFAIQTPLQDKIDGLQRKLILRETARQMGLPSHNRPKKAAQYSSGILKEMRRTARREGLGLSEWTAIVAHEL